MTIFLPNYKFKIIYFFLTIFFMSCTDEKNIKLKDIEIVRFEQLFQNIEPFNLKELKSEYPFFFPSKYNDSVWTNRLKDSVQKEIFNEVQFKYKSTDSIKNEISLFFNEKSKYFNNFSYPKIFTVNSDIDYKNKIILADSILLIALDNYLGEKHPFYKGIPKYIREDMESINIISDISEQYAKFHINQSEYYTFLDKIIYFGKILYFKDVTLPNYPDNLKIGYSLDKMKWADTNQYNVWIYFIENDILFSPESSLDNRFINNAPFSIFYSNNDSETSEMIGKFIGWQIVRSYAKNNNVSLTELLNMSPVKIYNNSKFKPLK